MALARALARRPQVLLLDEPLSSLDAPLREQLRRELRRWLVDLRIPTVLVTHDRVEAMGLGDQVVVLDQGRVLQSGPVHEVFGRPADVAVARIVGVDTVEPAQVLRVADGLATVAVGPVQLVALAENPPEGDAYVCIHAEDVIIEKGSVTASSARNRLAGSILTVSREGPMVRLNMDCGFPLAALVTKQACEELNLREGERVTALVKAPAIHLVPGAHASYNLIRVISYACHLASFRTRISLCGAHQPAGRAHGLRGRRVSLAGAGGSAGL